jgi:hypothetical protein
MGLPPPDPVLSALCPQLNFEYPKSIIISKFIQTAYMKEYLNAESSSRHKKTQSNYPKETEYK